MRDKFLVEFINHLTKKDLFIAVWLFGAALFSYLMWSYNRRANQRNFREDSQKRFTGRSLTVSDDQTKSKANVVKKD